MRQETARKRVGKQEKMTTRTKVEQNCIIMIANAKKKKEKKKMWTNKDGAEMERKGYIKFTLISPSPTHFGQESWDVLALVVNRCHVHLSVKKRPAI